MKTAVKRRPLPLVNAPGVVVTVTGRTVLVDAANFLRICCAGQLGFQPKGHAEKLYALGSVPDAPRARRKK